MMPKRVAISGASSFTALWIAEAFYQKGWKVLALCPGDKNEYSSLKEKRLAILSKWAEINFSIKAEDGSMENWASENHFDVWIHHHHFMEEFRSEKYNLQKALDIGIKPLPSLLQALKKNGCNKIIFSGSYFEPGEESSDADVTPYSNSKKAVWKKLENLCDSDFLLSKIVIPNPIGPLENEDRLIPILIKNSLEQKEFTLTTPEAVADQLPVRILAQSYVVCAEMLLENKAMLLRPSGLTIKNKEFIEVVLEELVRKRLKIQPCKMNVKPQAHYTNFNNPVEEKKSIDWVSEWNHYTRVLKELEIL